MGLLNPTLRDPGPAPGSAAHWTIVSVCQAERIAAFGPSPERAQEDFERWNDLVLAFTGGALVVAFFDPIARGYEAFDIWADGGFIDAFPDVLLVATAFGTDSFENWLSSPWSTSWGDVTPQAAQFGGVPHDDFNSWAPPPPPTWATAMFDGGTKTTDGFEGTWLTMTTL